MSAAAVAAILSRASRAPLAKVERVGAVAGESLEGDRHARPGRRRSVLLARLENLNAFGLAPGEIPAGAPIEAEAPA